MTDYAKKYATGAAVVRQWVSAKTTGDKLDLVFQNIADHDGTVETIIYIGGRDFIVCYSVEVRR